LGMATVRLQDPTGTIQGVWFKRTNPRYDVFASLRQHLQIGQTLTVFGQVDWGPGGRHIRVEDMALTPNPEKPLEGDDRFHFNRIVPLYTGTEEISERILRTLIGRILERGTPRVEDVVPEQIRKHNRIQDRFWSLQKIHFPES